MNEQRIIQASLDSGNPIPLSIVNSPKLNDYTAFFWNAFWTLDSCRNNGFSIGHIPWTCIMEYADRHEIVGDLLDSFVYVIRRVDQEYVTLVSSSDAPKT